MKASKLIVMKTVFKLSLTYSSLHSMSLGIRPLLHYTSSVRCPHYSEQFYWISLFKQTTASANKTSNITLRNSNMKAKDILWRLGLMKSNKTYV